MKAIVLLSGGLDSTLAAAIVKDLGIELIAFNTVSPFCLCNHHSATGCFHGASVVAKDLGLRFISRDVGHEFLEIVKHPPHGYGSNMNPCIDCRILLFKKAVELMASEGAQFIITGEVVGQRPMSQMPGTLRLIDKEAGLVGLVVRPLSAGVLEPTIPEQKGWIPRERLLAFNGRGRREQFDLAKKLGINDYPCPSGGCLLTDSFFCRKVKDLIQHDQLDLHNVKLLRTGRHFRLEKTAKLVVGRNEGENERLAGYVTGADIFFQPQDTSGPSAIGRGFFSPELIELSYRIVARYCDRDGDYPVTIAYRKPSGEQEVLVSAAALSEDEVKKFIL